MRGKIVVNRVISLLLAMCLILFACTACSGDSVIKVEEITKNGNLVLAVTGTDFLDKGFAYGDLITVTINGQTMDMPVGTAYSDVNQGSVMCRVAISPESGEDRVVLAINMGDLATTLGIAEKEEIDADPGYVWHYQVKEPVKATIVMKEKGGYYDEWVMRQLVRSNHREDYVDLTDAQYANYRVITTTGMGENKLSRSSSPINPELNRNLQADAAAEEAGIRTIINLADSVNGMWSYEGFASTYYVKQQMIALSLGMDFTTDEFRAGLAQGLRYIIYYGRAPYLVHCNEGKDRTGFFCAVVEALMGASAEEIVADYMLTYYYYYGLEPDSESYDVIASSNIQKTLAEAFGMESIFDGDLRQKAEEYLKGLGLTDYEISRVREELG